MIQFTMLLYCVSSQVKRQYLIFLIFCLFLYMSLDMWRGKYMTDSLMLWLKVRVIFILCGTGIIPHGDNSQGWYSAQTYLNCRVLFCMTICKVVGVGFLFKERCCAWANGTDYHVRECSSSCTAEKKAIKWMEMVPKKASMAKVGLVKGLGVWVSPC